MRLTANHVRDFVGVSRTDFHRWLTALPPYSTQLTQARKTRVFDARDLIFFATVRFLITDIGLRLNAVANFSEFMRNDLSKLSDLSTESRWVTLFFSNDKGWSIGADAPQESDASLKVDLTQIWSRVHQFMGLTSDWTQANLPLGLRPMPMSNPGKLQQRA